LQEPTHVGAIDIIKDCIKINENAGRSENKTDRTRVNNERERERERKRKKEREIVPSTHERMPPPAIIFHRELEVGESDCNAGSYNEKNDEN
jgi:hypothetical protein